MKRPSSSECQKLVPSASTHTSSDFGYPSIEVSRMQSPTRVLRQDPENVPAWLDRQEIDLNRDLINHFFSSRIVYYPGAGQDGRAFRVFGATHSVHCFLHIDLTISAEKTVELLNDEATGIRGYVPKCENIPPEILHGFLRIQNRRPSGLDVKSALWTILIRHPDFTHDHGPERLAFLHVQAEAVRFCDRVWGRLDKNPFAIVLKDHTWGGNWTTFGGTGGLYEASRRTAFAKYHLVAEGTDPWPNYESISRHTKSRRKLYRLRN